MKVTEQLAEVNLGGDEGEVPLNLGGDELEAPLAGEEEEKKEQSQLQTPTPTPTVSQRPMSALDQMRQSTMRPAGKKPSTPVRGLSRNKSGPSSRTRRTAPKRSQSHKIGRPVFNKDLPPEPPRGVRRTKSGHRTAPGRAKSFGKSAPDRASSSNSLRGQRRPKQQQQQQQQNGGGDDDGNGDENSVCDSVFTSASNQTLDSIMVRKGQMTKGGGIPGELGYGMKRTRGGGGGGGGGGGVPEDGSSTTFEFDESLHTVDSLNLHMRNQTYDDQNDMSVFSESFYSSDDEEYAMSDYDESELLREETEFDEEAEEEEGDDDDPDPANPAS